jgi:hypothetical protein
MVLVLATGVVALWPLPTAAAEPTPGKYFKIRVVDEQTGRGVPLVELETVNQVRHVTDSNGIVAFYEPGLMGEKVFFTVRSHGYEFPKDGFGFRGRALDVTEGASATLKVRRVNLAERLYRVTGGGIYADSVLVGAPVPLRRPTLNGQVFGSDSVVNAVYRGKLYWFWGDTTRPAYPLGNFDVPGATSALPGDGGLDPAAGVELDYFLDGKGFAKPTAAMPGPGPTWIGGLVVVPDKEGKERLFASYVKVRPPLEVYEHGLAVFNDDRQAFEKVTTFPERAPAYPGGHPFLHTTDGTSHVYFAQPYPLLRVRADAESLPDLTRYEGFTCLVEGTRPDQQRLDRAADGSLRYAWKKDTPPLGTKEQAALVKAGRLKPEETLLHLCDADTGKAVTAHAGSVYWNRYRGRWVMLTTEIGGTSFLGEVWYAEADTPVGPWVYARKVVTHDRYSFYNPKQHPVFDRDGGRVLFFEGTYTHTFSGNNDATPRYDYNQVMYRLDLANPGLVLPVAVYRLPGREVPDRFAKADQLGGAKEPLAVAFFAPDRPAKGTVPVYEEKTEGGWLLKAGEGARPGQDGKPGPLFHALPANCKDPPATTVPLYEFVQEKGTRRAYSTDAALSLPGYRRAEQPLFLVWRNPLSVRFR